MRDKERYIFLNNIYNSIKNKEFFYAEQLLKEIDLNEYKEFLFEIKYLNNFLNETRYYDAIKGTNHFKDVRTFLKGGKDSSYFDDLYNEYNYYTAGIYVTNEPIFYYLTGKLLFGIDEYKEEAVDYFKKYIELEGASKLYKAYEYLAKYYNYTNPDKSKKYYKRYNRLCLLMNINNVLYDDNSKTNKIYFKKRGD